MMRSHLISSREAAPISSKTGLLSISRCKPTKVRLLKETLSKTRLLPTSRVLSTFRKCVNVTVDNASLCRTTKFSFTLFNPSKRKVSVTSLGSCIKTREPRTLSSFGSKMLVSDKAPVTERLPTISVTFLEAMHFTSLGPALPPGPKRSVAMSTPLEST